MSDADRTPIDGDLAEFATPGRARRLGILFVRLALDALLIDAAFETWRSPSPLRTIIVLVTAAFVVLTLWVVSQGGRVGGRGWLTDPAAPLIVLLGFLVAATGSADGLARGVVMLGRPANAVLVGTMLLLVLLAVFRLVGPAGVRTWWARLAFAALGVYAAWAFALALRDGTPFAALIGGDGAWRGVPAWLRGARVGAFAILPLAFVREIGMAMVRLTFAGLLRWMIIFALGVWIAVNAASL
ncbi:MAG TPA: hypothetical protein VF332_07220 [Vicinamibacterales bacterium]